MVKVTIPHDDDPLDIDEGVSIYVRDAGHLYVYTDRDEVAAIYAPGHWRRARVVASQ